MGPLYLVFVTLLVTVRANGSTSTWLSSLMQEQVNNLEHGWNQLPPGVTRQCDAIIDNVQDLGKTYYQVQDPSSAVSPSKVWAAREDATETCAIDSMQLASDVIKGGLLTHCH